MYGDIAQRLEKQRESSANPPMLVIMICRMPNLAYLYASTPDLKTGPSQVW